MPATLQEILHFENLVKVINEAKATVVGGILPEVMFRPTARFVGNQASFYKITSTRRTAQLVMYGAPSKAIELPGVAKVPVTLLHSYESFQHEPNLLQQLMSTDGRMQQLAEEECGRKSRIFAQRFVNLRRAAAYSALTLGKIYIDKDGELTVNSGDALITIDFGIPAGHFDQLNIDGSGNVIDAKWSTAATDIPGQIATIQKFALTECGYGIKHAFYGKNVPTYIASNTAMKEFLKMNPAWAKGVGRGTIPNGFIDLLWTPAYAANYEAKDGTTKWFFDDDMVLFTPDENDLGWWSWLEGSYAVPGEIRIAGDATQALASVQNVFGMGGYAEVTNDPVGIKSYGFDTFLPALSVAKSIYIATVHW